MPYHRPTNFVHVSSPRSSRQLRRSRFISFHFISFRSISSPSHLISFHFIPRARPSALRCAKTRAVSDVFSFPCNFFSSPSSPVLFIWRFARRSEERRQKEEKEALDFIPVVNNIFIAAPEKRGVRKCNSEGCLPLPCAPSTRHDRAAPRHNSFFSDRLMTRPANNTHFSLEICVLIFLKFFRIRKKYNYVISHTKVKLMIEQARMKLTVDSCNSVIYKMSKRSEITTTQGKNIYHF